MASVADHMGLREVYVPLSELLCILGHVRPLEHLKLFKYPSNRDSLT